MVLSCRGDIWLSDDSNNNIIYRASFIAKDKERYNSMLKEAQERKYNVVLATLGIDEPYEFVDEMEGKIVLPRYIKLLDLFSSEENFEYAIRLIEYFESTSTNSDIVRMTIEKMWPEFSFFCDAMSCVGIERYSEFYDIPEIKELEQKLKVLKRKYREFDNMVLDIDGFSKIYSYQNDTINNMKVLSLLKRVHKITHPIEEQPAILQQEKSLTKELIPSKHNN